MLSSFRLSISGITKTMNSTEKDIVEMLHRQAILARSKEMFIHELQI